MTEIYSVLITGASRGIGLEFVRQFLTNSSVKVKIIIAACRSPEKANVLLELSKTNEKVHLLKLDVNQFDTYDRIANEVKHIVGDKGLTLLVNNAGIIVPLSGTLEDVLPETFISVLTTNSIAPVLLTKVFRPLLKQSAQVHAKNCNGLGVSRAAVINISSYGGSITLNKGSIALWSYKESKAALNMSSQSLAIELESDGILVESFDPGCVHTDMTGGLETLMPQIEMISPSKSVSGIISVMLQLTGKNKEGFLDYKGNVLPF